MHLLGQIAVCTEIYTPILKHLQTLDTKFMNILSLKNTKFKFKLFWGFQKHVQTLNTPEIKHEA